MTYGFWGRKLSILAVLLAYLFQMHGFAQASGTPAVQLDAPALAVLTVNTEADGDIADNQLSLREALEIVGGASSRAFTTQERSQTSGCSFSAGGILTGGCTNGNALIAFAPGLVKITLATRLPIINQPGIILDGAVSAGRLVLNSAGLVDWGLNIAADNAIARNLTIINIAGFGAAVSLGNGNWKGLQLYNNYLGIIPGAASCSDPAIVARPYFLVAIFAGSGSAGAGNGTAYISNNVFGCTQNDGVSISNAPYVYVGQASDGSIAGNWIGITPTGNNIGFGSGVTGAGVSLCCTLATQGSVVTSNHIGYNAQGVLLNLVSTNSILKNEISYNRQAGIYLIDSNTIAISGNRIHHNDSSGIWFDQSAPAPLKTYANTSLDDVLYQNGAAGITEGNGASQNTWSRVSTYANFGLGIDKGDNGAPNPPLLALSELATSPSGIQVNGVLTGPMVSATTYHIELYRVQSDSSGYGEGAGYIGSYDASTATGAYWSLAVPGPGCYTATLTVINSSGKSSSEFSANLGTRCHWLALPLTRR